MKDLMTSILSRSVPIVLLGASALTTGIVYAKITSYQPQLKAEIPHIEDLPVNPEIAAASEISPNTPTPSVTLKPTLSTPTPTRIFVSPTTTPSPSPLALSTTNRCLVILFGSQYDVTPLRSSHPGGDIFKCGTDMTSVYQSQHGTNLSRMQPYLVTSSGQTSGNTNLPSGGQYEREEEDRYQQDSDYEDKYVKDSGSHEDDD